MTQDALAGVVRLFDAFDFQKRLQPIAMVDEFPAHPQQPVVAAERAARQ